MSDAEIDVQTQHPFLALDPDLCRRVLRHVATSEGVEIQELSLVLADHDTVLDVNRRYLDHDYPTDVLAFDFSESSGEIEGEIYVDLDTADERHGEFEVGFAHEALRYAVHGLLHLVGYTDHTAETKAEMHELEDKYLRETGVSTDG